MAKAFKVEPDGSFYIGKRRHLIPETFSDRQVHSYQTLLETIPATEENSDSADRTPSDDPAVIVEESSGGDPGIRESLRNLYANEPTAQQQQGLGPDIMTYVGKALGHG